jgi:hypothetical protein
LRDQVEKLISHLRGLKTDGLVEEAREGVPRRRNTLGRMPHSPFSTLVTGVRREEPPTAGCEREEGNSSWV